MKRIIKRKESSLIIAVFMIMQLLVFVPTSQASSDTGWDEKGKVMPDKKSAVKKLQHAMIKPGHRNITLHRHNPPTETSTMPSVQSLAGTVTTRNYINTGIMEGLTYDNVTPPDVQIGAGPNNIIEMVNLQGQVWTKTGSPAGEPFDLSSFFGTGDDFISDPKIFYDNQSGRWFTSITDVATNTIKIAVSDTSNATDGVFCLYTLGTSHGVFPDQPILGVSNDKVVVAANDYDWQFRYSQFWVLNKSDLMACAPLDYVTKTMTSQFSIHPVQSLTSTSTQYMASLSHTQAGSFVNVLAVNGVPPNPVSLSITPLKVSSIFDPPNALQGGSSHLLDTGDSRIQDATWAGGLLWLAHNNSCIPKGDNATRACLHFVEIDTNSMKVKQDFNYGTPGKYLFYPAFAEMPSTKNLLVVFGYSSATDSPGIEVTEQAAADPPNTLESPTIMKAGKAPVDLAYSCVDACRYGDYFGAALDPSTPNKVWVAGEYGSGVQDSAGFGSGWGTAIGNFTG